MRRMVRKLRPTCKNTSDHEKKKIGAKKNRRGFGGFVLFPEIFCKRFFEIANNTLRVAAHSAKKKSANAPLRIIVAAQGSNFSFFRLRPTQTSTFFFRLLNFFLSSVSPSLIR